MIYQQHPTAPQATEAQASPQASMPSPMAKQHSAHQKMANNSPRTQQAAQTMNMARQPIQRAVGFEFEIGGVRTYEALSRNRQKPLAKGTELAPSAGGVKITADDPPTGSQSPLSDLELIIDPPIDDTDPQAGRPVMARALVTMQKLIGLLNDRSQKRQGTTAAILGGRNEYFYMPEEDDSFDSGQLQATAGLSLRALANIRGGTTRQAVDQEASRPQAPQAAVWKDFMTRAGAGGDDAHIYQACYNATANVRLKHYTLSNDVRAQLAAVMSLVVKIPITARTAALPYPKSAAGNLMARTDFGAILNQLPSMALLSIAESKFDNVLLDVINTLLNPINPITLADRVFPNNFTTNDVDPVRITLGEWFFGLKQAIPIDRLNNAKYTRSATTAELQGNPNTFFSRLDDEKESLESLGSYGSKMDADSQGDRNRPIFEFRNLPPTRTDNLVNAGLAIWDYVVQAEQ